jgi:uncharacterized protein (DUF1501 family)
MGTQRLVDDRPAGLAFPWLTRRQWLGGAAASFGALLLPARSPGAAGPEPKARAAIILFLQGGLSHLDSFDPKPDAPAEVRGEFRTIATNLPGVRFCEQLPLLAQRLHRFSLVRSTYHPTPDHIQAIHITLCGSEMAGANIDFKNHNVSPAMGAVVAKFRGPNPAGLPGYVAIPHRDQLGRRLHYGDSGYLGPAYSPIDSGLLPDRADAPYAVPANLRLNPALTVDRLRERVELLEGFEGRGPATAVLHEGTDLLARDAVASAFDLGREPLDLRRRYGDHGMGQEAVLARRLAESGVPFTLVNFALDQVKGQDWDTHEKNFQQMQNVLLPPMDRAVSTLLDDLHERGLLETTLVAVLTEFGRTPKINANAGRDHWPNVFSVLLAGGGVKPGVVVGASTGGGDVPKDRPVHVYDVLATIYHQLGIPADAASRDGAGRPAPVLAEGRPIAELI